jgi:hypothetical protein
MRCSLVIVSGYNTHIWIKENNFSPFILYLPIGYYNRAKLKFSKIITTTSWVSVRNIIESAREGARQIANE